MAADFEPERCSPIIDQVEFCIAPAPRQLPLSLFAGPGETHAPPHDSREYCQECLPHVFRKCEIRVESALQMVIEYAANAPVHAAMGNEEIIICPFLDRKSTRLNSSHYCASRMPSSA